MTTASTKVTENSLVFWLNQEIERAITCGPQPGASATLGEDAASTRAAFNDLSNDLVGLTPSQRQSVLRAFNNVVRLTIAVCRIHSTVQSLKNNSSP